jgi:hypothetical protein
LSLKRIKLTKAAGTSVVFPNYRKIVLVESREIHPTTFGTVSRKIKMKRLVLLLACMLSSTLSWAGTAPISQQQKINICDAISIYSKYTVPVKDCLKAGEFEAMDRVKNRYFTYTGTGLREDVALVCTGRMNKISRVVIDVCSWE